MAQLGISRGFQVNTQQVTTMRMPPTRPPGRRNSPAWDAPRLFSWRGNSRRRQRRRRGSARLLSVQASITGTTPTSTTARDHRADALRMRGVNGGGLNHYTGQEKVTPAASWSTIAMALDWSRPPRLQNGPSFHYVHSDQWRYEKAFPDLHPREGPFAREHFIDLEAAAVRMGWLPFTRNSTAIPLSLSAKPRRKARRPGRK